MKAWVVMVVGIIMLSITSLGAQATMNQVRLAQGETDVNRLTAPVYDSESRVPPVAIGTLSSGYDKKRLFVRRGGGNMFTRGPEYKLNAAVDIAALFTEALGKQGRAMGLRMVGAGEAGWQVSGTIREVYLESRQIPYGATLFYGYLEAQLQLASPNGANQTVTMRLHNYCGGYNAGMGRRDEAESCAAQLLVEGAQELLARLNRDYFKAAPSAAITKQLTTLDAGSLDRQRAFVRALGLSSLPAATASLLTMLPTVNSESGRAAIIDAIAVLGSPSAVGTLADRYAKEDEDPRWYTLKAMDYIGGDEAMKVVRGSGANDVDTGPKRLAQRIMQM